MSLRARILNQLQESLGISRQQIVSGTLLGRPYRVIKGTLRPEPDYDDAWVLALAQEARCVFDIDCNIGYAALILLHPGCVEEIVLVDPNPLALGQAAQNLILNGLGDHARFVCAFASDQVDGSMDFFTVGSGAAGSMYAGHARTASSLGLRRQVPTTTLDRLFESLHCLPDLVKIDVEGAEYLVLKGAGELARRHSTRFCVEMHSNPELSMLANGQRILDWCRLVEYDAWYLKHKVKLESADAIARRGRCHLLLLPRGTGFPQSLLNLEQGAPLHKVSKRLVG